MLGVLTAVLLTGCGRSVAVDAPSPVPGEAAACRALLAALPDRVDDAARRPVTPDAGTTAAWGDPPITLRCGVAAPTPAATAELVTVSGVDWLPEPLTAGVRFTTVDRSPTVIVDVPSSYAPEAGALADLADSLGRSLTVTRR